MRRGQNKTCGGFSLLEILLVASILGVLARAMIASSDSFGRVTSTGNVQALLQEEGERALTAVIADLRRSGFVSVGGKRFPYLFTDGVAEDPFTLHSHAPAASEAEPGDPDFGPNREIVFALPADVDSDGRPDIDAEGVLWSADEFSYVVVTRPDGRNYLERRENGGARRRVAHDIERIVFDDHTSSPLELPLDTVRLRVFLRTRDSMGALYHDRREVVVRLRNGSEIDLEEEE